MFQVICKQCHKEFEAKEQTRSFCSQSCAATHNNIGRIRRVLKYCLNCSNVLTNNKKVYCNNTCQQSAQKKVKIDSGLEKCSSQFIRRFLLEKHGSKCMKCGWCEVNKSTGKVPIELNHIDGNSQNNEMDNLELLCPNCHSLTPNFRALNKGNGRHKRRMRYKNGQSY
jgi:hypothetical protein